MKAENAKLFICVIVSIVIMLECPDSVSSQEGLPSFRSDVTKIIDGDTIEVTSYKGSTIIRLWGIDTPEWDQPYAFASKKFLTDRLLHKRVVIEPLYYDKHKRLVANILLNGNNISRFLLEYGFAWVHVYYCDKPICKKWRKLESISRDKKRGLWQNPSPVPPWIWKRTHSRSPH